MLGVRGVHGRAEQSRAGTCKCRAPPGIHSAMLPCLRGAAARRHDAPEVVTVVLGQVLLGVLAVDDVAG